VTACAHRQGVDVGYCSDGNVTVLFFPTFAEPLFIGADAIDAEVGLVFGYTHDVAQGVTALNGTALLREQPDRLRIEIRDTPFTVQGCPFGAFVGGFDRFVGVGGSASVPSPPSSVLSR
jgi:hypothetical protein